MQTVEITAKTVHEATKAAAEKLGVTPDDLKITVLEETKGLFGKSSVRVRAEVVEAPAAEPSPQPGPTPTPVKEVPVKAGRRGAKAPKAEEPAAPVVEEPAPDPAPVAPAPVAAPASAPVEAKPPAKRTTRGRGKPEAKTEEPEAPAEEGKPAEAESDIVATAADGDRLTELVRELLAAASLQVNAKTGEVAGRYVNIHLDGKDAAFLVGKHGEVLNAFQYLVNIIAGRRFDNGVRVTLDGNDYRRRREDALTQLATKIADQVKQRGEEAVLDALPAFERRIVHKALSGYEGISTYSEGEEPNRRVVIAPVD